MSEKQHEKVTLGRPINQIREELMNDEETQKIAETLDIELEEYVDLVLDYAQHPTKEPELEVVDIDDPDFEMPSDIPSAKDLENYMKGVADGTIVISGTATGSSSQSEFAGSEGTAQRKAQAVAGGKATNAAAPKFGEDKGKIVVEGDDDEAEALKKQLLKGQTKGRR